MRQGSWLTLVWWILNFGVHVTGEFLARGTSVFMLCSLGLTLLVQRGMTYSRAIKEFPAQMSASPRT
jgi:hypothetical protein